MSKQIFNLDKNLDKDYLDYEYCEQEELPLTPYKPGDKNYEYFYAVASFRKQFPKLNKESPFARKITQ